MTITVTLIPVAVFILGVVVYILSLILAEPNRATLRSIGFFCVLSAIFLALNVR